MRLSRSAILIIYISLLSLLTACGGLAGEPQIVATIAPQPTLPPETGYPLQPPDLARGAQIYAANCTRCHGVSGAGDGEFAQSGEVPQMASFTDPATARDQTLQEWFNTITNGRIENLMPPWREALTEADRWNVALYTYTMAYTPEQIAQGKIIWETECAECHGEQGLGDGPEAANINRPIGNLTEQSEIVTYSDQVLYNIVTEGQGENMPAFANDLNDEERRAVVAYARTLTVANPDVIGQAPPEITPEPESTAEFAGPLGTVSGLVTNGTAASSVPADLQVNLLVINQGQRADSRQMSINADGTFTFTDVPIIEGASYITATVYRDRVFSSGFVTGEPAVTTMDMPITIYELTEDPAVISIGGIVSQVSAIGDTLEVRQVIRFSNSSDRVYTTSNSVAENVFASLIVTLPPGAQVVSFDDPQRYIISQENFSIVDTAPVFPGDDHLVIVVYILPYDGSAALIEQPMNYRLDGQVRLLMYPDSLEVSSDQLPLIGPEVLGSQTYEAYGGTLQLVPGDVIGYEVSGAAATAADVGETTVSGSNTLSILLAIIGVGAILAGLLLYLRNRNTAPNQQQLIDALIRQIAELDDAHAAGQLNHDLWHRQRTALKARLAALLGDEKEQSE
jgi:mono/diheme cytochrome c family protein